MKEQTGITGPTVINQEVVARPKKGGAQSVLFCARDYTTEIVLNCKTLQKCIYVFMVLTVKCK